MTNFNEETVKLQEQLLKSGQKPVKDMLKIYQSAMKNIQMESDYILKKYQQDGKLSISDVQRQKVLKSLSGKIQNEVNNLNEALNETTENTLNNACRDAYYHTAYLMDKNDEISADFALLRPEMVESIVNYSVAGLTFSERIWNDNQKLTNRLSDDLTKAIVNGKSTEKLSRQIAKDFGVSAYEAGRLINTETARVVSAAQDKIYNESDAVVSVIWSATLEANTCDECAENDGKYFNKNDHPLLPAHPNCRCCIIPVVEGWKPQTRLDNEINDEGNKENIGYVDYKTWYDEKYGLDNSGKSGIIISSSYVDGDNAKVTDIDYINSREYKQKFKGISGSNRFVDQRICHYSQKACIENSRTSDESHYYISALTGRRIDEKHIGNLGKDSTYDPKFGNKPNSIILTHNHPNNTCFSIEDFQSLNNFPALKTIIACGHDGRVTSISIGEGDRITDKFLFDQLDSELARLCHEYSDTFEACKQLCKNHGWIYKEY